MRKYLGVLMLAALYVGTSMPLYARDATSQSQITFTPKTKTAISEEASCTNENCTSKSGAVVVECSAAKEKVCKVTRTWGMGDSAPAAILGSSTIKALSCPANYHLIKALAMGPEYKFSKAGTTTSTTITVSDFASTYPRFTNALTNGYSCGWTAGVKTPELPNGAAVAYNYNIPARTAADGTSTPASSGTVYSYNNKVTYLQRCTTFCYYGQPCNYNCYYVSTLTGTCTKTLPDRVITTGGQVPTVLLCALKHDDWQ
jgi:hypothetical protein